MIKKNTHRGDIPVFEQVNTPVAEALVADVFAGSIVVQGIFGSEFRCIYPTRCKRLIPGYLPKSAMEGKA